MVLRAPAKGDIELYLKDKNPLEFGAGQVKITDIDPEPFSGHFNYLIEGEGGRAVLRLKGPEWGSPIDGIENEYNVLKYVEKYDVAPGPLFFDREGLKGTPLMLMEFLDGKLFTELSEEDQKQLFSSIGAFIAEINSIPVDPDVLPFDYPLTSYMPHRDKWWKRVAEADMDSRLSSWCAKAKELLPHAEVVLERFEPSLQTVIDRGDSCFVFVSSHAQHLMVTEQGFRFLNWEGVRYGDPTFSLAVFLSSIADKPYYDEAKKQTIERYLEERPVNDFERMLDQRIRERAISDFTWLLWMQAKKGLQSKVDDVKLQEWYDRAGKAVLG